MEVREQLKEIIEKQRTPPLRQASCRKGIRPMQRLEVPKSKEFGDYSTNASMRWAKAAHRAPRQIAEVIVKHIDTPLVAKMDIAGAGFINFFLAADTVYAELEKS